MVIYIFFTLIVICVYVQVKVATRVQGSPRVYTGVHACPRVSLLILLRVTRVKNACHTRVALNLSLTCTVSLFKGSFSRCFILAW